MFDKGTLHYRGSDEPSFLSLLAIYEALYWEYDLMLHRWEEHAAPVLNETEKAILTLSIQGLTINAIAEKVHLAVDSVKTARRRLYEKLEVNNISEAISYVTNYKLL